MGLQFHNAVAIIWQRISAGNSHIIPNSNFVWSGGRQRLFTSLMEELALEHGAAVPTYQCISMHACYWMLL